ncbi:putative glycosyl hydrolase or carbohydrate binding protein [Chitinophaga dinghuensis]|uniref:Putative glycosyl hydrolase or carbohydrate binding protein n=1 Tax=Chitinophaga dinghuensis TaxID=1539050 RepID=A0A327VUX5_9BACT|nr:PCMD domain-containing protein [Chitinophaga dinghuensis]RAJ79282.1 putative glycosyl hydrolase or carbohydrate binding protein [Chitinophaga dinghuensis]
MNLRKPGFLAAIALFVLLFTSCIKDAPLNPEADIDSFIVDKKFLTSDVFIDQANAKVLLYLKKSAYDSGIVPRIVVTPGATITPPTGDTLRFDSTGTQQYTVTSQSGKYHKVYTVNVVNIGTWAWDFENWMIQPTSKYLYPIEPDSTQIWSSGNPGVSLAGVPKDPSAYPLRDTTEAYHGNYSAVLETRGGTTLSGIMGIRLFAGSLYLGVFDSKYALTQPLAATQFGQPYLGRAARFTGYYKYRPGAVYQNKAGKPVDGAIDSCSIYAVLYRGTTRLDGTNIHTSDRVVAVAQLPDGSARGNFTRFDLPFVYKPGAITTGSMMLAIVISSSQNGDKYEGAIGSRLLVDSLKIIHE